MSTVQKYGENAATPPDRFEDPGLPEHHPRRGDLDPRQNKKSERIVLALFALSSLGTLSEQVEVLGRAGTLVRSAG